MDHAGAILGNNGFFRVIIKTLANDQHRFAVTVAFWIWQFSVACERHIPRHSAPEIPELIARVPHVVSGRVDSVLLGGRIIAGTARNQCGAYIRLALEDADRCIVIPTWPVKLS